MRRVESPGSIGIPGGSMAGSGPAGVGGNDIPARRLVDPTVLHRDQGVWMVFQARALGILHDLPPRVVEECLSERVPEYLNAAA